ncbi:MAG: hypothetical protein RL180_627 [Pseudomonadota bacterium]|jgi:predicted nucleic acid-binding protein
MTVVDAAVWIDYLEGHPSMATDRLDQLLGVDMVLLADLGLMQVLQHFQDHSQYPAICRILAAVPILPVGGAHMARQAADNLRLLHQQGHARIEMLSSLIATYCIEHHHRLLFTDMSYQPFVQHLGLQTPT